MSLKDKLRQQKSSTDATTAEQLRKIEEELNTEWQEKSDRLLAAATAKHSRAMAELKQEKTEATQKVKLVCVKVGYVQNNEGNNSIAIAFCYYTTPPLSDTYDFSSM